MSRKSTTTANRHIVLLKDDVGWYADIEGSRQQNALVAGADKLAETLAVGKNRVEIVFSSDVKNPGLHFAALHRIEHDPFGATYRVCRGTVGSTPKFKGLMGLPILWICNQCEKFLGEHPRDIFVHVVS